MHRTLWPLAAACLPVLLAAADAASKCGDFNPAFCGRHAAILCGHGPTAAECAHTCDACATEFATAAAADGRNNGSACTVCESDERSYTDCGKCDFGGEDKPCERMTALIGDKQSPLAKLTAWSPHTGAMQLHDAQSDYVTWAPALGYLGDGYLYVAGGDWIPQSDKAYRVDMRQAGWPAERLPDLPQGRDWPGNGQLGSVGRHLVACSGWTNNKRTCEHLDLSALSEGNATVADLEWQSVPVPDSMCGSRATVATHKCRVYVAGGTCDGQENEVHSYDPYTKTFRQEPSMLYTRNEHGLASAGDMLIACGGWGGKAEEGGSGRLSSCEALMEGADEWVEIAPMTTTRVQFSLVAIDRLAAIGGEGRPSVELMDLGGAETEGQWKVAARGLGAPWRWYGAVAVPHRYIANGIEDDDEE